MTITIDGTTGIAGVDGSAATPAAQGTDTNTGIFYGTDIVAVSTGGTERLRVSSDGGMYMAGATGASLGAGTVNATGLYVNGAAVGSGVTVTTYTSGSGTWTIPSIGTHALVRAWGGGGSGARPSAGSGHGGGGGAYVERYYKLSDLGSVGATISYAVAAGGASVSSGTNNGNVGGNSTFASGANLLTAYGGGRGSSGSGGSGGGGGGVLGAGGDGTGGSMGGGATNSNPSLPWGGGGGANDSGTSGGVAYYGGGGGGSASSASIVGGTSVGGGAGGARGVAGSAPGGGGGGGSSSIASGAGGNGRIEIWVW